jgi:hypothetical protein
MKKIKVNFKRISIASKKVIIWFKKVFKNLEKINTFLVLLSITLSIAWLYISYKSLFIAIPQYQEFIENNKITNLNWNWEFAFITEKADLKKYIWMEDKYDIFLIWNKNSYKWKGEKYKSYWNIINPKSRSKIEFDIIIKDNKLYWFFNLYWSREVSWNITASLNKKWNKFIGTFITSAANSEWKFIWILKK